jgi:lysozyme
VSATSKALALIKQFEGCRLKAYPDPGTGGDPYTVGWGATGPDIHPGTVWTQDQADNRLLLDVTRFARGVAKLVTVTLTEGQMAALISFAYNCGLRALGGSTLLRLVNAGDFAGASAQFGRWDRAAGKRLPGLTRRRAAERACFDGR